jgi:S-methylmethionine-dependent homocysteine/selenocysteine methylase
MKTLNLDQTPALLDGGFGRELSFRGIDILRPSWSANALLSDPDVVRQIHLDYIEAGADIIMTNTYGIIRSELAKEGMENHFEELNLIACQLANEAREKTHQKVMIAGSLPPLFGSYRPDLVRDPTHIIPLYEEQAKLLAPQVDFFLCETMSSALEAQAAATAACQFDKPVWIAWTLHEKRFGCLRSGETISTALEALVDLPVSGILVNCCTPESITKAMPDLVKTEYKFIGGYANAFLPIPSDWKLDGDKDTDGSLDLRTDLDPDTYGEYATEWLEAGATIVGGCCGTRPAHIAKIRQIMDDHKSIQ